MKGHVRKSMDLRSQDLNFQDIEMFRRTTLEVLSDRTDIVPQELLMFSSKGLPYHYNSIETFRKDIGTIPDDAGYFYYSITYPNGDRCALYLDPDRPAKLVVEGEEEVVKRVTQRFSELFPPGGRRYLAHGKIGIFIIWAIVVSISAVFLVAYSLISGVDPYLIAWVIFVSSMLGIYLSIAKAKDINPANTMAFGSKRRRPLVDTLLHFITVALGILSVILVLLFVEFNL